MLALNPDKRISPCEVIEFLEESLFGGSCCSNDEK